VTCRAGAFALYQAMLRAKALKHRTIDRVYAVCDDVELAQIPGIEQRARSGEGLFRDLPLYFFTGTISCFSFSLDAIASAVSRYAA